MASNSSSSSSSSFSSNSIVSQEEFKTFHNIDRILYIRLVVNLERDIAESMQVIGLWLWLERSGYVGNFVNKMLSLPDSLLSSMAEEAVLCLNCIQNEHFLYLQNIPLLNSVSKTRLSLQFFHENRVSIAGSVSNIVNQVCSRAFHDISSQVEKLRDMRKLVSFSMYGRGLSSNSRVLPDVVYSSSNPQYGGHFGSFMHGYDTALQKQILTGEIGEMLSRLQICTKSELEDKDSVIPADDRTIFLTFSKGYPIVEEEVRDFFSRKYGDCIEAIHMQEVLEGEHQPLYARLVVRSPAIIPIVLDGNSKAKFSINGKHVWARKYVRKNTKSPPQYASSSSQPNSPAAP